MTPEEEKLLMSYREGDKLSAGYFGINLSAICRVEDFVMLELCEKNSGIPMKESLKRHLLGGA